MVKQYCFFPLLGPKDPTEREPLFPLHSEAFFDMIPQFSSFSLTYHNHLSKQCICEFCIAMLRNKMPLS